MRASNKDEMVYISDMLHIRRRIDRGLCTVEFNQLTCLIDGELVSSWSGPSSASTSVVGGISNAAVKVSQ